MKFGRKTKITLFSSIVLIVLASAAYLFLTSSYFICSILLPEIGRKIGAPLHAKSVNLSLFNASAEIRDFSAGKAESPFFRVGRINVNISILKALKGEIDIEELNVENPSMLIETFADGTSNIPFLSNTKPAGTEDESEKTGKSGKSGKIPKIKISNFKIAGFDFSYTDYRKDKSVQTCAELHEFSVTTTTFTTGVDTELKINGKLKMKSGDSINITDGKFEQAIKFRLNDKFIPEIIESKLSVTDLGGVVNKTTLNSKSLVLECLATLKGNDLEIQKFVLSGATGDEGESKITVGGKISFEPLLADLDIEVSPLTPELTNVISQISAGFSPGNLTLFYKGHLGYSKARLMSSGSFTLNQKQAEDINIVLKGAYDIESSLPQSSAKIKILDAKMELNGRECAYATLEKSLDISWKPVTKKSKSPAEPAFFRIRIDNISLPLLNSFIPGNFGLSFQNGNFSSDINAAIIGTGETIRLDGVVALKDLGFKAGGEKFSGISSSLNITDFELSSFSNYRLENLSFRLLNTDKLLIELKGSAEGNINEGTFKTDISEFSTNENLIGLLPEEQQKSFPLSTFALKGSFSALHKSAKDDFSLSGTVSTSNIKLASPLADIQPENSTAKITFACIANTESIRNLNADLLVSDFKYRNAVLGLKLGSSVEKISFKENSLEVKSIEGTVTLARGGRVNLKCDRPFNLNWGATPLGIKPSLAVQVEISGLPLENMHCFFDPSEGYRAEGGTGTASISCEFRDGFNLTAATTSANIENFSFSSCGHSFKNLTATHKAEVGFDGWTKLNVNSCETTMYSQGIPLAKLADSAKFDFTAGTGTINTKAILLNEKLVGLLPEELKSSFGSIRKISLNSSDNSFSYDEKNLYTSGKIIATGFLPDSEKIPESDFKLSYDIRTKDKGYEFRDCTFEDFIGNARAINLAINGYCDPSNQKYNLKIESEQADIKMIAESLKKDESQTGDGKSSKKEEESPKPAEGGSLLPEGYDIDTILSLKNISYGESIKGNLNGSISLKNGLLKIQDFSGNINEAPIKGWLAADTKDSSNIRYNAELKIDKLELGPVITPFVTSKQPFKGVLEGLEFNAESQAVTAERPLAKINGALKASFSKLSIPTALKEKSFMANLILTPIETIASIGKYLPVKYIPSELSSAASIFTDYFQNFDNVAFDTGEIAAVAKDGMITIQKCDFRGTAVKELTLTGTVKGSDGTLDTRARTKIGKLIVPLRIKGTFSSPSTEYTMILPDFMEANAANLFSVKNIEELLKTTGEKGKDSGEKTIDVINNILNISPKDKKNAGKDEVKEKDTPKNKEKLDAEGLLNLFKKKKKKD